MENNTSTGTGGGAVTLIFCANYTKWCCIRLASVMVILHKTQERDKMKVLELFAGTRSIGKAFEKRGHEVFSVEWNKDFENIDLYADILTVTAQDILEKFGKPDIIWASPDCTTYSVAAISKHRRKTASGELLPISDYAKFCDEVNAHVI